MNLNILASNNEFPKTSVPFQDFLRSAWLRKRRRTLLYFSWFDRKFQKFLRNLIENPTKIRPHINLVLSWFKTIIIKEQEFKWLVRFLEINQEKTIFYVVFYALSHKILRSIWSGLMVSEILKIKYLNKTNDLNFLVVVNCLAFKIVLIIHEIS